MTFPDYAIKYSQDGMASKKKNLDSEQRAVADDIVDGLSYDPLSPRPEILPFSIPGQPPTFIYRHPDPAIEITYGVDDKQKVIYLFYFTAPKLKVRNSLFISYSHKDSEWLTRLRQNLSSLEQQGLIEVWDDGQLRPGEKWDGQIKQALDRCVSALLLVSPDFLSSSFITDVELPTLLKGGQKKIFWIHVRRSKVFDDDRFKEIIAYQSLLKDPKTPLSDYNDDEKKAALDQIASDIRAVLH